MKIKFTKRFLGFTSMTLKVSAVLLLLAPNPKAYAADTKISALVAYPAASWIGTDLFPIVDITNSLTKKTSVADFDTRYLFALQASSAIQNGYLSSANFIAFAAKLSGALTTNHIFVGTAGVATDTLMSGEASIVSGGAVTLSNAAVIAKLLTGYVSGPGVVTAADSILTAIQKIDGNTAVGSGVTTIGVYDSQASAANGLVIVGTNLYAQSATAANPGMINQGAQTMGAGVKTFSSNPVFSAMTTGIVHSGVAGALTSSLIVDADVSAGAAIAFSKLAALPSGDILVGSAGNVATAVAMSGDTSLVSSGAVSVLSAKDTVFNIYDAVDATKKYMWNTAGQTTATTATMTPLNTQNEVYQIQPNVDAIANVITQNTTSQQIFIGSNATIGGSNSGIQYSNATTANRGQIKLHSYFAGASIAGVSTLTSRSGVVGTNSAVVAGQDYSKWTAQAGATTPGSAPISGTFSFKANTVNALTVTSDYHIQLANLAGVLGDRLYLGSEGALQLPNYTVGIAHFDGSGNITSSAVNLAADVGATILPLANGGTNKNLTASNGAVAYSDAAGILLSAVGTSGQLLQSNGAAAPTWLTPAFASSVLTNTHIFVGNAGNVATDVAMSGEATIANTGAVTLSNAAVIAKVLTGYVSGPGIVTAADSILTAIQKIDGNTAAAGITSVGAFDGQAISVNGASIVGSAIYMQSADATHPGMINLGAETMGAGIKTFSSNPTFSAMTTGIVHSGVAGALTSSLIVDADVAAGAAIAFSKLAALPSGDILVGSAGNVATAVAMSSEASIVASGAVTLSNAAVIGKVLTGYVSGAGVVAATDSILQAIQKLDGNTAASLSSTLTSAHIFVGSAGNVATDTAVSGDISITNAGVTAYAGTVPINKGGTNGTTATAGFDNLSPLTTKGDIVVFNGTNNIRVPVSGTNGNVLTEDSAQASGVKWAAAGGGGSGFTYPTVGTAYGGNNVAAPALTALNITSVGQGAGSVKTSGNDSTFYGFNTGNAETSGTRNTIIGSQAGITETTAGSNTYVGYHSGNASTTAENVMIGANAGDNLTSGSHNTFLGYGTVSVAATDTRMVVMGHSASGVNNGVTIGDNASSGAAYDIAIGVDSAASGGNGLHKAAIAIGNNASAGSSSVTIGTDSQGATGVTIGANLNASGSGGNGFWAGIGQPNGVATAVSGGGVAEISFGTSVNPWTDMYLGEGANPSATTSAVTIQPASVLTGTSNQVGAHITILSGNGTGTGGSGAFKVKTAPVGASSSNPDTYAVVFQANNAGAITLGATGTTPTHVINGNNTTGASIGTLTNSPVAGNPAGYLQMTINGTTHYIPYW